MPIEWIKGQEKAPGQPGAFFHDKGAPAYQLHLWPHRSLPPRGFVAFIGITAGLFLLPLIALLGTPVLWGILPFLLLVLSALWMSLRRSYRDGQLIEVLSVWPDRIELVRHNPGGRRQEWSANPHWTSLHLSEGDGPVPKYLTLRGSGREVELGAFLSPEERAALHDDLQRALLRLSPFKGKPEH
ncbi:DUF2244 domain-containing protein [Plastorhodobacter daqingensis]|uniref:DUF2244 domain-containing protein n=1 Tax=Plastorhodobacter daqingensis TaxID=1387281 RepID=A0ABW2UIC7_9RHOB